MDCSDIPIAEAGEMPWADGGIRRPYAAYLEVTQRCNNLCTHCYLDPMNRRPQDLPLDFWVSLFDALIAEETLFLVLTGGEPLLRPDFAQLYLAAKQRGFIVSIFTNARLVDEALLELFHRYPPRRVSISIYGATRETYEGISRVPGSFDQAMRGIRLLHEAGINLHTKSMILRGNCHEMPQIRAIAEEIGAPFSCDGSLHPTVDRDPCVLCERMDPEALVEMEARDPARVELWRQSFGAWNPEINRRRYTCAVGMRSLYVSADGQVKPCAGGDVRFPLDRDDLQASLHRIFYDQLVPALHEIDPRDSPCSRCRLSGLCGLCSAGRGLETGSSRTPSEFACRVALLRARAAGIDEVPAAYA